MEIHIGELTLTSVYSSGKCFTDTYIIIKFKEEEIKVLASELKASIEALEKTCWRP